MPTPQRSSLALLGFPLLPVAAAAQQIAADPPQTAGRAFRVVFQKNFRDIVLDEKTQAQKPADPLELQLAIIAEHDAHGYVEIPGSVSARVAFPSRPAGSSRSTIRRRCRS